MGYFHLKCCTANQLTGFYMRATLVFNGLRVTRRKNFKIFRGRTSLSCVLDEIFIEAPFFEETSPALKKYWRSIFILIKKVSLRF